jgi:CO/xanthine dehydrogenase Mo-binding subunit
MDDAKFNVIGRPVARLDAYDKVIGEALYPGDLNMPGMLFMKILFAERPHARIIRLDTSKAETHPGVVAIFTAKDVPVNEYGLQQPDQPVLCGPGSDKVGADVIRFIGDQIALVVAETEEVAAAARDMIEVEFEDLPIVAHPLYAMQPNAPLIHPERSDTNVCVHYKIRKGDTEVGFAQADVIVQSEYRLPFQEHAYLQPEAGLAYIDEEGRVTVQCGGQWPHTDRAQIAHALGLPEEQVRVIYPAIGGAFGGREDMSVQIVLALAAWKLQRPVKIVWSRRESIIGHGKRHPVFIRAKWGATHDGKLTAAETEIIADAGAYLYTTNKVLGNTAVVHTGPYFIPNVKADIYGVYTNNPPTCAFRGFGAPQGNFIAEMQMNKLAEAMGMDPVAFRLLNALKEGDTLGVGTAPPGPISVIQVVQAAAGGTYKAGPVTVEAVPAYNINKTFHPRANGWLGYIVTLSNGQRIYHSGDTDAIPEMKALGVDVALMASGGTYTMTAAEAGAAANAFKPAVFIPMHWGDIIGSALDAKNAAKTFTGQTVILQAEK